MDTDISAQRPNRQARRRATAIARSAYAPATGDRFVREPECQRITGLSRSTRWRLERARKFPRRCRISTGAVGWLLSELEEWVAAKAAG
jgi:prophage regulatory protein